MYTFCFSCARRSAGVALVLSLTLAPLLVAHESQQDILVDTKLLADNGIDGDSFGTALAVEGDIMVVAAPGADVGDQDEVDSSGVVYVFLRDQATGQWLQHQKLVPTTGHYEGNFYKMPLAIHGSTIVVGAPYVTLDRFQEGAVYVFERDETGNWAQTARITDVSVGYNGHFGKSLAIDDDLLLVGATQEYFDVQGRVGIFQRDRGGPNNWGRVTTLYGRSTGAESTNSPNDLGFPSRFGTSLAIEGDLILVGAPNTTLSFHLVDGAAYLFRRSPADPDRWEYLTRLVRPGAADCTGGRPLSQFYAEATPEEIEAAAACANENPIKNGAFGDRVAMQGNTVVVGARGAKGEDGSYSVGEAHLYERDPSGTDAWPHIATLSASDPSSSADFAGNLVLAGDTLVVSASGKTIDTRYDQGAVYVFERDPAANSWHQIEKLVASDGLSNAFFGEAVALDGHTRLIGAMGDHAARGAVYLHEPALPDDNEEPCAPSYGTTAELSGAGMAAHVSGVLLGAVAGTLSGTLPVWIHEVAPPAEPLFDNAVPLGAYYNVGAECSTSAPQGAPFVVALPVPAGADPSSLGAAALASAESLRDAPISGRFWEPVSGTYDASNQLFMFTLGALEETGHTVVLIQHPDLGPVEPTAMRRQSGELTAPQFFVQCFGFANGCGVAEEAKVQQKLLDAYVKFNKHNFPSPALDNYNIGWDPTRLFSVEPDPLVYKGIYIRSSADPACSSVGTVRGFYNYVDGGGTISFCIDPNAGFPDDDRLAQTATHELFHATQHAFDKVREESDERSLDHWVLEGTADAAIFSDDEMHRGVQRDLRNVSVPLTHKRGASAPEIFYPYQTQDFWVHLLTSSGRNLALGEFISFFTRGASTEAVADRLANPPSLLFENLGQEYWAWVQNQVVEKKLTFDNTLENPCTIEDGLVDLATSFTYPALNQVFDTLEPLQSELVQITFRDGENPKDNFNSVRVVAEGDNLKYKVYLVEDFDADPWRVEPNCVEIPDGGENGRSFDNLTADSVVYVLLSRIRHEEEEVEPPLYRVWIDREALPQQRETKRGEINGL